MSINVKSAWLERQWRCAGSNNEKADVSKDGYQLIVVSDEKSLKGFNDKWLIGIKQDSAFYRGYQNDIITDLNKMPTTDTINWKVQSGNQLAKAIPKTVIGEFSLTIFK